MKRLESILYCERFKQTSMFNLPKGGLSRDLIIICKNLQGEQKISYRAFLCLTSNEVKSRGWKLKLDKCMLEIMHKFEQDS